MSINFTTAIFLIVAIVVYFAAKLMCAALTEFLCISIREFMKAKGIGIMREHWEKKDQEKNNAERRVIGFQTGTVTDQKEEP